jgi:hypothetical protein
MSGWLDKLGRLRSFKRRWFVLKDGMLFRYKTMGGAREQLGKIALFNAQLSEYQPQKYTTCFEIKTKDKTIVLRAGNEEEMHSWLNAIIKQKVMVEEMVNAIIII